MSTDERAAMPEWDREGLDRLYSATYEELRRLAALVRGDVPGQTLNPTALVNEAYLRLAGSLKLTPDSRLHWKRLAARAMRQVLVDAARRRKALKRGGELAFVTFDDALAEAPSRSDDLIALNDALEKLERLQPRQAMMVELRFFGGYDLAETAELLDVSEATLGRDWRAARAWLARELRRAQ